MEPTATAANAVPQAIEIAVFLPWLLLFTLALPMVWVAWRLKVYPSIYWTILLAISLVVCVLMIFVPSSLYMAALYLAIAIDGLLLMVATLDLVAVYSKTNHGIEVLRELPRTVSIGVPTESELTINNRSRLKLVGEVRDDLPEHFKVTPSEHVMSLPSMGVCTVKRTLTPMRRGAFELARTYMRFRSPARLWIRYRTFDVPSQLNVYPDMKQLSDYTILARTNRLSLIGVRRTRRIGQDSDFERLRDYTRDDNYRHIDWKSTARRRKLTVRQYQSDQSQRLVFMLDCGRMMTNSRDGMTLLDHSLNSMLMMAYVALSQGDAVGLLCFSDTVHSYIAPRGGSSQMNRLLQAGFDQFPRLVESRYDQAFLYLSNHCKRRSLVVLATNVIDEVNAESVVDYLGNLSGQHLPLGVLLRDRQMFDAADHPDGGEWQMYRAAAAADILLWRDQVLRDLQHRGVLTIDAFADELTAPLVNQYLDVKAKHML